MNLAGSPLIPLYQVQADPDARFQRFGRNDSQLFGKPINAELQAPRRAAEPAPAREKAVAGREDAPAIVKPARYGASGHSEPAQATPLGSSLDLEA